MSGRGLPARLLWYSGLATAARRVFFRRGRFVLTFHGVAAERYPELPASVQPSASARDLRATLAWLGRRFRFLTPRELLRGEAPGVLLTFDDGFANHRTTALPILEEHGAPAVFFVTARHVLEPRDWLPSVREKVRRHWARESDVPDDVARDLYDGMSRDELREVAAHPLITVGSHTVHHPRLTGCAEGDLAWEVEESKALLEAWCDRPVELFAYPKGDYDRRVARAVRDAGYGAAFAEDPVGAGLPDYEIPRIGLYAREPAYLGAKLSGLHRRPWRGTARAGGGTAKQGALIGCRRGCGSST